MKVAHLVGILALVSTTGAVKLIHTTSAKNDRSRTITEVVNMLQGMLDKSKADGTSDREAYAKYKCYCDKNKDEKEKALEEATTSIEELGNSIEELTGSTGNLVQEVAALKKDMDDNEQARSEAEAMRTKENEEYLETKKDLGAAIASLSEAIDILAEVGGDQTMASDAAHDKFMANYEGEAMMLTTVRTSMKKAMDAAGAFLDPTQRTQATALLQKSPFGTYSSQSGAVVGILKNMKETFESNLKSATEAEEAAVKAHGEFMKTKGEAYSKLSKSYDSKQSSIGTNDGDLASKREQLETAKQTKSDSEEFLSSLTPMCEDKAKEYAERKMYRANEEAAIAKAIFILSNENASKKFEKVSGGGAASFLQIFRGSSKGGHLLASARMLTERFLSKQIRKHGSQKLSRVVALLKAGNPFTVVLEEIDKTLELIDKEAEVDKQQLDWCNSERTLNDEAIGKKESELSDLDTQILNLDSAINDPDSGLKAQINTTHEQLDQNAKDQTDQTEMRRNETSDYQENIRNFAAAEAIISKAIALLKKHYSHKVYKGSLIKMRALNAKEEPAPPEALAKPFTGQKEKGNEVIGLLEGLLSDQKTEENKAHEEEQKSQVEYEDSMQGLKDSEADMEKSIADLTAELKKKEMELEAAYSEQTATEKEKMAMEHYLKTIKPGCDFITDNYDTRESNRQQEKDALNNAVTLLKESPAFKTAEEQEKLDAYGGCKSTCVESEAHANCQACLAKVSVPGYCAGHPDTPGCDAAAGPAAA